MTPSHPPIPSGIAQLDEILGGGFPRQRITQLIGDWPSLELLLEKVAGGANPAEGIACITVDGAPRADIGPRLSVDSNEAAISEAIKAAKSGTALIVLSLVAAPGDARRATLLVRDLCAVIPRTGSAVLVYQVPPSRKDGFEIIPRDNAWRFFASVRLQAAQGEVEDGAEVIPCVHFRTVKHKLVAPFQRAVWVL